MRGGQATSVPELAAAVTSVLDREPQAVAAALAALTARRDAAAGVQAYEAAARLQEEIEAVEWVVAPQRVTAPGGTGDGDVTGWAGDVLVRLRIRGGRVRSWEQEPAPAPPPEPVARPDGRRSCGATPSWPPASPPCPSPDTSAGIPAGLLSSPRYAATEPARPVRQLRLVVEADDYEEAVIFYRDVLGLPEVASFDAEDDARVCILDAGHATLELANPAQRRMIDQLEVGHPTTGRIRVAFEVADAEERTGKLVEHGARLVAPPTETPRQSLNARLDAPAGLHITLFQELTTLDERERMAGFGTDGTS